MPGGGQKKGEKRGGRKKGTPNKFTGELKDMILTALSDAGGVEYLKAKSETHPQAFLALVGKVLPLQVTGKDNAPLFPAEGITFVIRQQDGAVNRT